MAANTWVRFQGYKENCRYEYQTDTGHVIGNVCVSWQNGGYFFRVFFFPETHDTPVYDITVNKDCYDEQLKTCQQLFVLYYRRWLNEQLSKV